MFLRALGLLFMALAGPMLYGQRCRNAASEHSLAILKLRIEFENNDKSGELKTVAGTAFFVSDRCAITAKHIVRPKDKELTNFDIYKVYAGFANTSQIDVPVTVHETGHDIAADSEGWRSAFRTDVDHDSEVMPISVPN